MSSIFIQLANIFKTKYPGNTSMSIFIVISLISTCYCLAWDYKMDWGLLRSQEPGKKYLRTKLLYPAWFYYYAMASNFVLRFFWILSIPSWTSKAVKTEIIPLIQCLSEGFRRAQWSLIRIENENVNNFERYRTILQIPAFKEEAQDYEDDTPSTSAQSHSILVGPRSK